MTQNTWNRLSFFEQLSNIDGEVRRLVQVHENYKNNKVNEDVSNQYLDKIIKLVRMTMYDPKNHSKVYRYIELNDEVEEIRKYLNDEVSSDYILRYWDEYTVAIS